MTWGAIRHLPLVLAPAGSAQCPLCATPHAAPVPLAEICGGLIAASPVLGAPGQVVVPYGDPPWGTGAQSWGPGTVPAAGGKRGQRSLVSLAGVRGLGGGEQLISF